MHYDNCVSRPGIVFQFPQLNEQRIWEMPIKGTLGRCSQPEPALQIAALQGTLTGPQKARFPDNHHALGITSGKET